MSQLHRAYASLLRTMWRAFVAVKALLLANVYAIAALAALEELPSWLAVVVILLAGIFVTLWMFAIGDEWRFGPRRDPDPRVWRPRPAPEYCGGETR